ncbi:lipopolysaccharide biosynthesis protein [Sporolactobacillus putidus]|uniref:Sugar isomerase n=1 Tax=Sporolactobacillus putidus TaxID=492735 RepID=A0A917S3Z9_9BACL|nr:polysaccharide biosynthesis C-terminal domain-containing protein [Sporolactobacillus putidus]GGL56529.1 hypothetical protein GCM10007968_20640 [Sporolactobacillus putidus]
MKAKRSILNLIFGMASMLITVALGIIIPRMFLVHFGSEVNGLISSIGQIIIYLSLLEAGVGAASLQALYKVVARADKQDINEVLSATHNYYQKTGLYYFLCVIVMAVLYPLFVHSSISWPTTMSVVLLTGLGGAFNYYFQGTYTIFVAAIGKSYINTIITTTINILSSIAKIVLIKLGYNVVIIQGSFFALTMFQIVIYLIYIKRNYKWLDLKSRPNFQSISQKNSVMIHQLSTLIFNNTDVLILTFFTNLKVVSVYVIYNMLFTVIDRVIGTVNDSITFALGQTFYDNKKRFIMMFDTYEVYFMAFVFSFYAVAYILVLPFMRLYTSGIKDINYIDFWLPVLFVTLKLLSNARTPSNNLINIAGHFKKTQYRSILESSINIVCSLIFVHYLGMYGVLMGTIAALLYRSIDMIVYANQTILDRNPWPTIRRWLTDVLIFLLIIFVASKININPHSYLHVIGWACLLSLLVIPIYLVLSSLSERNVYKYARQLMIENMKKIKKRVGAQS